MPVSSAISFNKITLVIKAAFGLLLIWGVFPLVALASQPAVSSEPVLNYCYQGQVKDSRIIVVDKYRQRLMVLRYIGELIVEYEFACATGSNPGAKMFEGDERTPVGIYFTTHRYKDNKVTIFGDRAIHLNYPNPFDQHENRQGNGIFFHGTNQELKPNSTNGCVVLRNLDMARLSSLVKDQSTPVVVVERFRLARPDERKIACDVLFEMKTKGITSEKYEQKATLALIRNNGKRKAMQGDMPDRLAQIENSRKIRTLPTGHILLGVGDRWVFVRQMKIRAGKRMRSFATRRVYLKGEDPLSAKVINHETVVNDMNTAKKLARLCPAPTPSTQMVVAAHKTEPKPAPVVVASNKPKPVPAPKRPETKQPTAAELTRIKEKQIRIMLSLWLRDWTSKNLQAYAKYYAPEFDGDGINRDDWLKKKAYLNKVYKEITVKALGINISVAGNKATVNFVQLYRSDWHRDKGKKLLELVFRQGRWLIVKEQWSALG